jgi:branched-chain amino acid transport system substrate-binding protein
MTNTKRWLGPGAALAGLLAVAACGSTPPVATTTASTSGAGCTGTVTVATELPTSGGDTDPGLPTREGAELAVAQANRDHLLGGSCTFSLVEDDDASAALGQHDPTLGAANMTALVADKAVVGVVGPFNSSVCETEQPIANRGDLAQISPSCTDPGLTIPGSNPMISTVSLRPTGKITFFRVALSDVGQGAGLAQIAISVGAKKAFVFNDEETYGQDLATYFSKDFSQDGGSVVGTASEPGTTTDFSAPLAMAEHEGANLIFFGGTASDGAGTVRSEMTPAGLKSALFMGGDGILGSTFVEDAGGSASGAYCTDAAPAYGDLPAANAFVTAFDAKYGGPPATYSANAYDAMNIILQAVKEAVVSNRGSLPSNLTHFRETVRANIAAIHYNGAIGPISFNSNGDVSEGLLTEWQVQGGQWTWVKNLTISS